ncbi:MAG: hypothetical protein IJT49_00605 [Clostridia bacterium]|nr:hypothetical protein [Clostridia bacterium]
MGKMVMKNMFDKNGFVLCGLDARQKKQNIIVTLCVIGSFIISAFTFMNFLYCLSDCIGSIVCASPDISLRDAIRSVPIFLSFFMSLSGLMVAHTFYRNESENILKRKAKKHAVIGIVLGVITIVYVIAMRIAGRYLSLVEGAPSPLYPLDAIIFALIFIATGIFIISYFKKTADKPRYAGPTRAPVQKKGRGVRSFFRAFWLLIGLYGFCGFFYSIFIVDFTNGYVPYIIAVMLVSCVAFASIAVWELYYNNLTAEKRMKVTLPLSLISVVVSVLTAVVYFTALKGNLDGPSNVGFGILPIAFSASVNFATLLVVVTPIIVSVTALIKGIYRKIKFK